MTHCVYKTAHFCMFHCIFYHSVAWELFYFNLLAVVGVHLLQCFSVAVTKCKRLGFFVLHFAFNICQNSLSHIWYFLGFNFPSHLVNLMNISTKHFLNLFNPILNKILLWFFLLLYQTIWDHINIQHLIIVIMLFGMAHINLFIYQYLRLNV